MYLTKSRNRGVNVTILGKKPTFSTPPSQLEYDDRLHWGQALVFPLRELSCRIIEITRTLPSSLRLEKQNQWARAQRDKELLLHRLPRHFTGYRSGVGINQLSIGARANVTFTVEIVPDHDQLLFPLELNDAGMLTDRTRGYPAARTM